MFLPIFLCEKAKMKEHTFFKKSTLRNGWGNNIESRFTCFFFIISWHQVLSFHVFTKLFLWGSQHRATDFLKERTLWNRWWSNMGIPIYMLFIPQGVLYFVTFLLLAQVLFTNNSLTVITTCLLKIYSHWLTQSNLANLNLQKELKSVFLKALVNLS